jgi:hypothetical protein
MPDLGTIMRKIVGREEPRRVQTPEEMLASMRAWVKELGGEDRTSTRPTE